MREQCNGPHNAPFAQCLDLTWVIVGDIRREDDEKLAPSQQDAQFLTIMQNEMYQDAGAELGGGQGWPWPPWK